MRPRSLFFPALNPVLANAVLRIGEGHFAGAYQVVEFVLQIVFFWPSRSWVARLGPQILDIVRSSEFQRDQVVNLIVDIAPALPALVLAIFG